MPGEVENETTLKKSAVLLRHQVVSQALKLLGEISSAVVLQNTPVRPLAVHLIGRCGPKLLWQRLRWLKMEALEKAGKEGNQERNT